MEAQMALRDCLTWRESACLGPWRSVEQRSEGQVGAAIENSVWICHGEVSVVELTKLTTPR